MAQALAHIVKVIDVERVVIGGGVSQAWALMKPAFDAQLNTDLMPVLRGKVHVSISKTQDHAHTKKLTLISLRVGQFC